LSIPADPEWLALFGGALTELLFTWNWEQSTGGLSVDDTIAAMQNIIDNWYISTCGGCELPDGGGILRMLQDGSVQELIDGEWQEPTGDYATPPTPARTESTADERKCLAAKNAAYVLQQTYEQTLDAWTGGAEEPELFVDFALIFP